MKEPLGDASELGFDQLSQFDRADQICDAFEREWQSGQRPSLEEYLSRVPPGDRDNLRRELEVIQHEYENRQKSAREVSGLLETIKLARPDTSHLDLDNPPRIARFRIDRLLGEGGFGRVYLAHDMQLERPVALKVPHSRLIARSEDARAYLTEARIVANLDHSHIVPVYDVGGTADCPCYVVSKYVDGCDLATLVKRTRLGYREAAELVATVAGALQYAHTQGVFHRDVKPGNILLGSNGLPYVVDFGLALQEQHLGDGPRFLGTPAYMSPEQASGEGHRVDGRSDIFSLGVVLYELLAGRRPFRGETQAELLEQVTTYEPRPLRQYDEKLPKELERVCQKALAKQARDRYSSAHEMAEDLHFFLAEQSVVRRGSPRGGSDSADLNAPQSGSVATSPRTDASSSTAIGSASDSQLIKIVPKGLRSFDVHDADFFLELLPGPRDREGLPDRLRFWKTRIEESDPDNTFSVGLIYGPSGCGKSSLVKAGLLPRLAEHVIPVYIEATPEETEARLLRGIQKICPALESNLSLKNSLAALRQGVGIPGGSKVLIVLDQFEQWLHAKGDEHVTLVQALRQCDGERLQCLIMVRDDFWLAVSRFFRALEVRLVEGENCALTDLFDLDYACKVLAAFGRAFAKLPDSFGNLSREQKSFLDAAVVGLAQEGKVICIRLALFAEMMKGKPWTPATLKEVGGTQGVGVRFLDETFNATTAPPEHRYHQKAARAVLTALLDESGSDIKGQMRSYEELLEASGYARRRKEFDDLIRILDSEVRLITPTESKGGAGDPDSSSHIPPGQKYYQLTHDYLVPSLRDWLTRQQKETRRGRSELRLAERSALWSAKPENRHLPSWWEFLNIRMLTDPGKWPESERRMMGKATQVHALRSAIAAALLLAIVASGITISNVLDKRQQALVAQKQEERNAAEAKRLVTGLLQADTSQVNTIVESLSDYRTWASDDLRAAYGGSSDESNPKLHAALAILPEDNSVLPFLKERLLTVTPTQFAPVRNLLESHKTEIVADCWDIAKDDEQEADRRFQAACALATYDADNGRWQNPEFVEFVAKHLVRVLPSELLPWRDALRPVKGLLTDPLAAIYRNQKEGEQVRGFATHTLADYLSDDADQLFELLADAEQRQFTPIFANLVIHQDRAIELGNAEITKSSVKDATEDVKEALALRQANVAAMLLRMNVPANVWPMLRHRPDPRLRSYIIHCLGPRGCDAQMVIARFEQEVDVTIKRALLLCLGEFEEGRLRATDRVALVETLLNTYRNEPDPGLHAAAEWLLRKWGQSELVDVVDEELQQSEEQLAAGQKRPTRSWYINGQGQTFAILDAGEFQMGSPETEAGRQVNERLHRLVIGRRFAISTKEVTKAQWREFPMSGTSWAADQSTMAPYTRTDDSPMLGMTWYEAAHYCNWLSQQEGIPADQWCYEPPAENDQGTGIKAKERFWELSGYRLPTEAEWELACRAGTATSRYYGESETLLPSYARYQDNGDNHAWPTAGLKPNDFGLFDMHGNAWEWCYDRFTKYPEAPDDIAVDAPGVAEMSEAGRRILRGAAFLDRSLDVRAAARLENLPETRYRNYGFRPARTYKL